MVAAVPMCWVRRVLVALTALAVLLFARPAGAAPPTDADDLQTWARGDALPRLAARATAAPEEHPALRELGVVLTEANRRIADGSPLPLSSLTDYNRTFWSAAGTSPRQTQFVLAMKIALLLADGRTADAAAHYQLVAFAGWTDGPTGDILAELAPTLGQHCRTGSTSDLLAYADHALDRKDFALAALAYRLAVIHLTADQHDDRDLPGHYLYCLTKLGVEGPMAASRARFYRSVVFPTIEAQSRQRTEG